MINKNAQIYCSEDICNIENYDKAIADKNTMWLLHHRYESIEYKTKEQLISEGRYYNQPALSLIFVRPSEHSILHKWQRLGKKYNKDKTKQKLKSDSYDRKSVQNRPDVKAKNRESNIQRYKDVALRKKVGDSVRLAFYRKEVIRMFHILFVILDF